MVRSGVIMQSDTPSPLHGFRMEDVEEELLCEGYLRKIRGFAQNRTRWFRLTTRHLSYYTRDGGSLIACTDRKNIVLIEDMTSRRLRVTTCKTFGVSGNSVMVLEAKTQSAKSKWSSALRGQPRLDTSAEEGPVLAEGQLNKLQPMGALNKLRWFVLTPQYFSYYREECGEIMARCDMEKVLIVAPRGSSVFVLRSSEPFTVSGASEVSCQCETELVRDKWLALMNKAMDGENVQSSMYSPLPAAERAATDHYGIAAKLAYEYDMDDSEGNRYIRNRDL